MCICEKQEINKVEKWKTKMKEYYSTTSTEQIKQDLKDVGFKFDEPTKDNDQ